MKKEEIIYQYTYMEGDAEHGWQENLVTIEKSGDLFNFRFQGRGIEWTHGCFALPQTELPRLIAALEEVREG